jgi:hypothetical protein
LKIVTIYGAAQAVKIIYSGKIGAEYCHYLFCIAIPAPRQAWLNADLIVSDINVLPSFSPISHFLQSHFKRHLNILSLVSKSNFSTLDTILQEAAKLFRQHVKFDLVPVRIMFGMAKLTQ